MAKPFYILFGFIALGLGTVGIILPLLPTTPLILLACFCFAKGSDRFHRRLLNTWFYKKHAKLIVHCTKGRSKCQTTQNSKMKP